MSRFKRAWLVGAALIGLVAAGCTAGDGASAEASAAGGTATTVDVTLQEWAVVVSAESAPAGDVTFAITNDGPDDIHEFVVLRTDLDPADLPVDETGAVDEEGEGMEVVDEVEDIPIGESEDLTVNLEPGTYALICNIYSEDEDEAHYEQGMRTPFEVTE